MANCPECQAQNPSRAERCSSCGANLLATVDAVSKDESESAQLRDLPKRVEIPDYLRAQSSQESPHQNFARRLLSSASADELKSDAGESPVESDFFAERPPEESPHQSFARRLFDSATTNAPKSGSGGKLVNLSNIEPARGSEAGFEESIASSRSGSTTATAVNSDHPMATARKLPERLLNESRESQPPAKIELDEAAQITGRLRARPAGRSGPLARVAGDTDGALRLLQRQATLVYVALLLAESTCLLLLVVGAAGFLVALTVGSSEQLLGVLSGVAGFGLVGSILVLLSPLSRRQRRLAVLMVRTQISKMTLTHNFELWETYFNSRKGGPNVAEIDMAVRSLSLSSQTIAGTLSVDDVPDAGLIRPPGSGPSPNSPGYNPAVAAKY
jgi:hypothetical protein